MAAYFFDSSALVKRYVAETGSAWVRACASAAANDLYIAAVTAVEVISALTRRARSGSLAAADAAIAIAQFRDDHQANRFRVAANDPRVR